MEEIVEKGVNLSEIIAKFKLTTFHVGETDVIVNTSEVGRPGLPLAGFTEVYQPHRVQIIGLEENTYISELDAETRYKNIEKFLSAKPLCIIFSTSLPV